MKVSTLTRRDHGPLISYLNRQPDVHYHLDWESVEQWLHDPDTFGVLAWEDDQLIGAMAFTPPLGQTTWLRLLSLPIDNRFEVFGDLWLAAMGLLAAQVKVTASMIHRQWVADALASADFEQVDAVINLVRHQRPVPKMSLPDVRIRRPRLWESASVLNIDHAAFGPLWQMRGHDLREAAGRASHYTVAHDGAHLVGYQLSIRYGRSLHLARLAILPEWQNRGVGRALVHDMLLKAQAQNIDQVTVNTQLSNVSSQRLYERMGFEPDGSSLPVYVWGFSDDPGQNPE